MPADVHFDFSALLLILSLVTGVVYALDKFVFAKRRGDAKPNMLVDFSTAFFPVIVIVFLLRSFVAEPFRIPSESMLPTLRKQDFILVNKFAYDIRLPVFHSRLIDRDGPERGDVVVFRFPQDPSKDYIKRVIGLPGDVIEYRNKRLTINGEIQTLTEVERFDIEDPAFALFQQYTERLNTTDGTLDHDILQFSRTGGRDLRFRVPDGSYFVMGDNRDRSHDSRGWGFVPERNLVGKAVYIWLSLDSFDRIGTKIQ